MEQWYAHVAGRQYGPVDRETLQRWIREGRIGTNDLVWSPGMEQWSPAGSVPGLVEADVPAPPILSPHRGIAVLVLGLAGMVAFCFVPGIIAWVMGSNDLREMDAGRMDPAGRSLTQAGRICGIITACIQLGTILLYVLMFAGVALLDAFS